MTMTNEELLTIISTLRLVNVNDNDLISIICCVFEPTEQEYINLTNKVRGA